ncbi:MAG: pyridoxal phosphate-dependent aminotransferase [Candidatus Aenigmarchaeota archaeon]|nr:pyridoxal phosphate-dependent aminotransferase [Candidatus Aenigmarchaeota archaeon]
MKPLAARTSAIKPSATLELGNKVKQMKKSGIDVIDLGVGEPDFDTPQNIKDAAIKALNDGFTKYTPVAGLPELRQAIADKLKKDNGIGYSAGQVLVSCGAKDSLYNYTQTVVETKDEVIVFSPYWVSYIGQIRLAGGNPVVVNSVEGMANAITPKTKAVIINSPNNPSGSVMGRKELEKIAGLAIESGIYVISDEIYEKFVYGSEHVSIASLGKEIRDLTITVNGFSKAYAMTGWRIGYAAAHEDVTKAALNIQNHTTSGTNSIAQKAALEAITGPQDSVEAMGKEFEKRRDFVVKRLDEMGIDIDKPKGAFYVFPDVSGFFGKGAKNSAEFSAQLLEKNLVATVPGAEFGDGKRIRISYAASVVNLEKAMDRLEKFLKPLK